MLSCAESPLVPLPCRILSGEYTPVTYSFDCGRELAAVQGRWQPAALL